MKKRAVISDYLPWLLMGIAILVILMITIFLLKGEGFALVDKLKGLFRSG